MFFCSSRHDLPISGVSFTREICRAVAGRIDNLGGGGTTFTVHLPVARP